VLYKQIVATPQGAFYQQFGRKLAEARRAAKITQEALSKSVGLSRTSIVNIEKGRQPVQLHLVARMATSLGIGTALLIPDPDLLKRTELPPDLAKVSEHNRPWVERIFSSSALQKESVGAAKVLSSKTQGGGTSSSSKGKKSTRSS
jgi:DNA-binding XRE family transcriptional regulator